MSQQYVIAVRLVRIIQTIQLNRETGTLIAKRGEGHSAEEGSIVFTNGRITQTTISSYTGLDGFNRISMWENCLVSFIPQDPSKTVTLLVDDSSTAPSVLPGEHPATPLPKGVRPTHESSQGRLSDTPFIHFPHTASLTEQESLTAIPSLIQPLPFTLQKIEQMGLSRAHRQLVLLINSNRSVEDLARIMSREVSDVQRLLHDLKYIMLI